MRIEQCLNDPVPAKLGGEVKRRHPADIALVGIQRRRSLQERERRPRYRSSGRLRGAAVCAPTMMPWD